MTDCNIDYTLKITKRLNNIKIKELNKNIFNVQSPKLKYNKINHKFTIN